MTSWLDDGWCRVDGLLTRHQVDDVLVACRQLLALPEEARTVGDKPVAGTHHLVQLGDRCDVVAEIVGRRRLLDVVSELIGPSFEPLQVSYRSPQPGFGAQKLHADGLPKMAPGPETIATAIVALVDFTPTNGSTRVVPRSHRRPDLQRLGGNLDTHDSEIQLTASAGCAFIFSGHLLHSGTKNKSEHERPALQLQWQRTC